MKSYPRQIGRSLLISLALHLSIVIVLMFVTLTKVYNEKERSFLNVSFIKLESPKTPIPRVAPLETPVQSMSLPNRQFSPTVTSPRTRSSITSVSKTSAGLVANVTPTANGIRLNATNSPVAKQATVQNRTSVLAHLPIEPSETESGQLKSDIAFGAGSTQDGMGQGQDSKSGKQRGVFSQNIQVESTPAKMSGIASLVSKSRVADADDVLADITDNVVLGGEIPPLPKGEPGGIIVGRGNDIKGRLNLVRLNDPLHPSLYG